MFRTTYISPGFIETRFCWIGLGVFIEVTWMISWLKRTLEKCLCWIKSSRMNLNLERDGNVTNIERKDFKYLITINFRNPFWSTAIKEGSYVDGVSRNGRKHPKMKVWTRAHPYFSTNTKERLRLSHGYARPFSKHSWSELLSVALRYNSGSWFTGATMDSHSSSSSNRNAIMFK